ncbi:MAG TPA: hypothetical protein VFM09_10675 [Marmoricola sp.]|nr:hypothetical protein [Marmoricola sp.]
MIPGEGGGRSFAALGFDPAPGDLGEVETLVTDVRRASDALGEAADLLANLSRSTGSDWQGEAADKFREHADHELPKSLDHAHDSFVKAGDALQGWAGDLAELQREADGLEREAEQAKAQVAAAEQHLADVHANPYHVEGPDPSGELAARASRLQQQAVGDATSAVDGARRSLQDVVRRARALQGRHHDAASTAARALHSAPDDLAPHKPGLLASVGHWFRDHAGEIGDVLNDISAVAGIVALVTPPPIDAIALGLSVGCALGAAGMHAWAGEGLGTIALDGLGALPGIGVLGDAAKAVRLGETVADGARFARGAESAGDAAFGARYALSGVGDAARAVPRAAVDGLEEAKVFGSNLSRLAVRGIEHVPGVTVRDGLALAANIDRGVAGVGAALGTADLGAKGADAAFGTHYEVPGSGITGSTLGGYGLVGQGLDWAVRLGRLPLVEVP